MVEDQGRDVRRPVRRQLLEAFGVLIALTVVVGVVGAYGILRVSDAIRTLERGEQITADLGTGQEAADHVRQSVLRHIVSQGAEDELAAEAAIAQGDREFRSVMSQVRSRGADPSAVDAVLREWSNYMDGVEEETLPASREQDTTAALASVVTTGDAAFASFEQAEEALLSDHKAAIQARAREAEETARAAFVIGIVVIIAALIVGIAAARRLSRRLRRNLTEVRRAADRLTSGDLTARASVDAEDETGVLADSFNSMAEQLEQSLEAQTRQAEVLSAAVAAIGDFAGSVSDGDLTVTLTANGDGSIGALYGDLNVMAHGLHTMASQIVEATQELGATTGQMMVVVQQNAGASSEQASAVTEVATTVDELRSSAEQTADRAGALVEAASTSSNQADEGTRAVSAVVSGMEDIEDNVRALAQDILGLSSRMQQATEIVDSVAALADRSNLLALNAGIEAAKAGEQGRGFAVVAAEVRSLAEQSREATDEIREILEEIGKATDATVLATEASTRVVNAGRERAEDAGRSIGQLADAVQNAASSAHVIAGAAREQSVGLDQIARAMSEISEAGKQVSASADESQRAIASLDELVRQLRSLSDRYRLRRDDGPADVSRSMS